MKFASKHPERENTFGHSTFHGGLNQEMEAPNLSGDELSRCKNIKYSAKRQVGGDKIVIAKVRQGTSIISNTAVTGTPNIVACTYYKNQSQYILATTSKLYYLDASSDPIEIGSISGTPTFTEFNEKLIIHDTGITKAWDGTTFETLNVSHVDEIIGTGDNVVTEFTATVDNPPIEYSSITITYTDTDVANGTITDDGIGRLTGSVDAAWVKNITGCADNGSGLIRVTSNGHGFANGNEINIQAVVGTTEANSSASNPTWTLEGVAANTFDLTGSTFTNAYTSGGTASKNTVIYTTGVVTFKCANAPDNATSLLCDYEEDEGAPKSKAGIVRANRLYLWGDSDNTSRIWYSGENDEDGWVTTSSGGSLDVDKDDGDTVTAVLNFFQSLLIFKEESMHRLDNFPGDSTFRVEPLHKGVGCVSHRAANFNGELITFLSTDGWRVMTPTDLYGDVQKTVELSNKFAIQARQHGNSSAYTEYNQIDNQMWLTLYDNDSSTYSDDIHVVNVGSGGQLGLYQFVFKHASYNYVNGEMLVGGQDGNLYKLVDDDSTFKDDGNSYSSTTYLRGAFTDWDLPSNRKHNKKINLDCSGKLGFTGELALFRDLNYAAFKTFDLTVPSGACYINPDGKGVYINDLQSVYISDSASNFQMNNKFNYKYLMWEIRNIASVKGAEFFGISFKTAIRGDGYGV